MKKQLAPVIMAVLALGAIPAFAQDAPGQLIVSGADTAGKSGNLKDMPIHRGGGPLRDKPEPKKGPHIPDGLAAGQRDPLLVSVQGSGTGSGSYTLWDGVGTGGGYTPNAAPPDTNGAVGGPVDATTGKSTQFVQWVNEAYAVYNTADGSQLVAPVAGNSLWSSFPATHPCRQYNDGDPIVQWDKVYRRWILTQFAVSQGSKAGYAQCVAVSQSEDARLGYNLYSFNYGTNFNDFPKVGVGSDGNYYVTYNMFRNGRTFTGGWVCAWDGVAMRAGTNPSTLQQCVTTSYSGLLPSDLDRSYADATPVTKDEYILDYGTNSLLIFTMHTDFANTANTKITGPVSLSVAPFSKACGGGTCIPQPNTTQQLDSLGDRLNYRLAYRQKTGYDSMVVTHAVVGDSSNTAARWYELRNSGTGWTVAQQGTHMPTTDYRWMSSAAMDKIGNIVMGYSVSSSSVYPDVRAAVKAPADATFGAEILLAPSTRGAQSGTRGLTRWGDYSSMSLDPADGCTMFFTTEYQKTTGEFNWSTRIGKVRASTCN